MEDARRQEAPSEQYARLKWKVARDFCRYNWKWPLTAYGATFNVISSVQQKTRLQFAKVERRLCRRDGIATRVYVVTATKRDVVTGCVPLKAETGWQAVVGKGILFDFHRLKRDRNLQGNRFVSVDRLLSDKTISDRLLDRFANNASASFTLTIKQHSPLL